MSDFGARVASFAALMRIEGVGTHAGQYTFCTARPSYAGADYLDLLTEVPDLIPEAAPPEGGVPEEGAGAGLRIGILDEADLLTSIFAADRDPVAVLAEPVDTSETTIDVSTDSPFTASSVAWVGSEALRVTATASGQLTVTRGWLDTAAVSHDDRDPVYLGTPYLEGRRVTVLVAPLTGGTVDDEAEMGTYVLARVEFDEALNVWILSGTSQLRYLDRLAPIAPRILTVFGVYGNGGAELIIAEHNPIRALWPDGRIHLAVENGEILRASDPYAGNEEANPLRYLPVEERSVYGTKESKIEVGAKWRQVFLGDRDLRYSPGPSPSTSRTSGTWSSALHWIDQILVVALSSADEADGLELTNRRLTGSDWSRSNFSSLPPGYGAGLPASLIDWEALEAIRARTGNYRFPFTVYGRGKQSFAKWLEDQYLRPMGGYVTVADGLVSMVLPRIPIRGEAATVTIGPDEILLREEDRGVYLPRLRVSRDKARAIGSVVVSVGPQGVTGTYRSVDFGGTYGQRGWYGIPEPSVTIDVAGGDPAQAELYGRRAASRLFERARPPLVIEVDASFGLHTARAGDPAVLTVTEVPDMRGTRGLTETRCLVESVEPRLDPEDVHVRLRLRRYSDRARVGRVAPSGYVASVSGVDATLSANRFTLADAADGLPTTDAAGFRVGDVVKRTDLTGVELAGGTETVDAIAGNVLTLSGDFGAALAAGDVLTTADSGDASADQLEDTVHFADRSGQTVGDLATLAWTYGEA